MGIYSVRTIGFSIVAVILSACGGGGGGSVPEPEEETPVEIVATKPLNDTGITTCGDYAFTDTGTTYDVTGSNFHNNNLDCSNQATIPTQQTDGFEFATGGGDIVRGGQDALYGADVGADNSDGDAGFNFTKLDSDGVPLADQTQDYLTNPWTCVRDNTTGLIWEVKNDFFFTLQYVGHTYTWYNSTGLNDAGVPGAGDTGTGTTTINNIAGSDNCSDPVRCDTEKYTADVNQLNICGETMDDWRLPTPDELLSIVHNGRINPAMNSDYFPTAGVSLPELRRTWTLSSKAADSDFDDVFIVNFDDGALSKNRKENPSYVRLVRTNNE